MKTISAIEQLNLEITWKCNLDCPMCPSRLYPLNQNKHLEPEQIKWILSKFPSVKMFNIIGLGEPLLHPQWSEIVSLWRQRGAALRRGGGFNFTTNATLLTKEKILELPRETFVAISLDTLDPEAYGRIRKNADLNQVVSNIKLLRKLQPRLMMFFNVILMRETIDKLHTLLPLAKQVGAAIHLIYPITFSEEGYRRFYPDDDASKKKIRDFKRMSYTQYQTSCVGGEALPRIRHCEDPFGMVTIGLKGDIYPCGYIYEARNEDRTPDYFNEYYDGHCVKVPQHQYLLGNIFTDDINKLYDGKKMNHIRNTIFTSEKPEQSFCVLRQTADLTREHEYCKICANRWGALC